MGDFHTQILKWAIFRPIFKSALRGSKTTFFDQKVLKGQEFSGMCCLQMSKNKKPRHKHFSVKLYCPKVY